MSERITTKYKGDNAIILTKDQENHLLVKCPEFGITVITGKLVDRIAKRENELEERESSPFVQSYLGTSQAEVEAEVERDKTSRRIFKMLMDDHRITRPCDGEFEGFIIITPDELGALLAAVEDTMKVEEK